MPRAVTSMGSTASTVVHRRGCQRGCHPRRDGGKEAPVLRWPIPWLQTELFKGC